MPALCRSMSGCIVVRIVSLEPKGPPGLSIVAQA